MATQKAGSYSGVNAALRREHCAQPTTAGATTEGAKFRSFMKMKLKAAHFVVITAGTHAAHGYDIYSGTTSIGTVVLGTSAAGVTVDSSTLNTEVASMGQVSVKSLADVVGVAQVVYEYEVQHDALKTV